MASYEVTLNRSGNQIVEYVVANNQGDARRKAERMNPGYKAGRAVQD